MILPFIFLAILYIALAVLFIAFSFMVFLGRKKIRRMIERIKSKTGVKVEIVIKEKSHI